MVFWSIFLSSSRVYFKNGPEYLMLYRGKEEIHSEIELIIN